MSDTLEEKNRICDWCSEETTHDDIKMFDLGINQIYVCSGCYEDLKSEYGIIGDDGLYFYKAF